MKEKLHFFTQSGKVVTNCPDCETKIKDEFPEVEYVSCPGCPRIFERTKPGTSVLQYSRNHTDTDTDNKKNKKKVSKKPKNT